MAKYIIEVEKDKTYCGIGAAGVQFANGKGETTDPSVASWYKSHKGYTVKEPATKSAKTPEA